MKTPRFEIFRGKNNEFFFRLKAKNGKIILQSEGYTQKHNCISGIECVREGALLNCFELIDALVYSHQSHFWFRMLAPNAEIIGRSETYTSKAGAKKGIEAVRRCAPIAEIVDLTKD